MCEITEEFPRFDETRVVVHPISVDSTYALTEYKAKYEKYKDKFEGLKLD